MFLTDKYIILDNKNDVRKIITYLYENGYIWNGAKIGENVDDIVDVILSYLNKYDNDIYLDIFYSNRFTLTFTKPKSSTFIRIKNILREQKLKRILK